MTAGRSSTWISRHKKIYFPRLEPRQELCSSHQQTKGVSEGWAMAWVSWVVSDLGGHREEGEELGHCCPPPKEVEVRCRSASSGETWLKLLRNLPTPNTLSEHWNSVRIRVQPVISLPCPTLVFNFPTWDMDCMGSSWLLSDSDYGFESESFKNFILF